LIKSVLFAKNWLVFNWKFHIKCYWLKRMKWNDFDRLQSNLTNFHSIAYFIMNPQICKSLKNLESRTDRLP
jgi:hypothetical protein